MTPIHENMLQIVRTRTGLGLAVRAASPEDEAVMQAFYDQVSEDDRRFRFFSAQGNVGHEQLAPMLETDHFRRETFLAFRGDNGELVAVAMLACDNPMEVAEVAISVRADYRGRGIGWSLLDLLAHEAQRRGVREVIAIEDRENHAAIELEREKGFVPRGFDGDPQLVVLSQRFA
ncbi:MAG: GNAT family N-acetyltransferase [Sphingomonadaceae bacterium]